MNSILNAVVLFEPQPLDPNEPVWSRPVACYVLGSLYLSMFVACVVLFAIIQSRDRNFSLQKTFYLLLGLFSSIRTIFWLINPSFLIVDWLYFLLWSLPGDLLFSTFSLLVFFWADAYHYSHSEDGEVAALERNRRRRLLVLFILNIGMYLLQLALYIAMVVVPETYQFVQPYFFSVIALISVAAFCVYGGLLIYSLRSSPIQSSFRKQKTQKVFIIVIVVTATFLIRAIFNFMWQAVVVDIVAARGYYWVFAMPFYFCIEILPTFLVLGVVTKVPPKTGRIKGLPLMADQ